MPPTLLGLPTETKVVIVRMIESQQDAWLLRKGHTTRNSRVGAREGWGGGLGELALVCKEFNQITAQVLFESVSATQMTPLFLHRILQRHSHLITRAEIAFDSDRDIVDDTDESTYDHALHVLQSLPNLRALTLDRRAARMLFGAKWINEGDAVEPGTIESFRIEVLKTLSSRVTDLTLRDFTPPQASRVLSLWTGLRNLRLIYLRSFSDGPDPDEDGQLGSLAGPLTRLVSLTHLEIDSGPRCEDQDDCADPVWSPSDLATLAKHPLPLTSFKLSAYRFYPCQFAFISLFHSTLTHLTIATEGLVERPGEPIPEESFRVHLPLLQSLHLSDPAEDCKSDITVKLLLPFLSSPLVDLTVLDVWTSFEHTGPLFGHLKNQLPLRRQLQLGWVEGPMENMRPLYMSELLAIRDVCSDRGIAMPTNSFFDEQCLQDDVSDDGELEIMNVEVRSLLEFGLRHVERGRRWDEIRIWSGLMEALRPLHEMKKDWRD